MSAKSVKSNKWFVRIDGSEEYLKDKLREYQNAIDIKLMLCAFHRGSTKENPHIHFVIEHDSLVQKQSYALRVKGVFNNILKRSDYSIDVWDGNKGAGACSYLFHEPEAIILVNKGFTNEEIEEAKHANDVVQKVISVNKEKASTKFVEKALIKFAEYDKKEKVPLTTIEMYFIKLVHKGEIYWPGTFRAKAMCQEVLVKLSLDLEEDIYSLHSQLFPSR